MSIVRAPGREIDRQPLGSRVRTFLKPRARTWALMIPLHLVAFLVLYVATARLLETEVVSIANQSAREQLDLASRELNQIAVVHTQNRSLKHFFEAVLAKHQEIRLKLLLPDGRTLGAEPTLSPPELEALRSFLPNAELRRVWLSREGERERVRGMQKVVASQQCTRCHAAGETLAVASMSLDLTEALHSLRGRSRRHLALLILAWAAALGGTTALVRFSVQRSTAKLQAELEAVEAGDERSSTGRADLVLDPAAAELHHSLREFLGRQRERRVEVASRLVQTDQLASLGRLAAGLAHEIKNPLAGIQGALEILREDAGEGGTHQELYREMLCELERVNETLQTLLSSARPSPPRLARTDLRQLLEEVHRLLEPGLRRQGVVLSLEMAEGALESQVDPGKIRQVLINLIQNAAEAMDGEGTVILRASRFPQGEGVILAVQDNGPGIPEAQQRKIFEPFFTTKFGGTGLGLAIARSLIEQHGGSLQLHSAAESGSTFYILLPDRLSPASTTGLHAGTL